MKLSIITVNFNDSIGLQKTIASVVNQNYMQFEYIIIDGGSSDSSIDVIKENEKNINFWVSEADTGIYNAMNKGIKKSNGEYLIFLNSGDMFTSNNALSDFINHPNFKGDIIYGDYQFLDGNKIYPDTLYPTYFMKTSLPHQSTFFRKSVFDYMGLYDEKYKIGADRAFYIKSFLSEKLKFQHVQYFLTLFDLSGISNDPSFILDKKEEDEFLLKEEYGLKYDQYKKEMEDEIKNKATQRNSFRGVVKRILYRIKKI